MARRAGTTDILFEPAAHTTCVLLAVRTGAMAEAEAAEKMQRAMERERAMLKASKEVMPQPPDEVGAEVR